MGEQYTPIFIFLVLAICVGLSMVILSASPFMNPRKKTRVKQMPYESGMDPIGDARQRFDVRFYLVAIVFLLFDVELLFLYPWAVAQWSGLDGVVVRTANSPAAAMAAADAVGEAHGMVLPVPVAGIPREFRGLVFTEILVFIVILAAAFAYAWRKGVFEWR
ncbi:MAG: NADH-quinone oxidoreductase subunit A [Isosphaeraceae bacterium]